MFKRKGHSAASHKEVIKSGCLALPRLTAVSLRV